MTTLRLLLVGAVVAMAATVTSPAVASSYPHSYDVQILATQCVTYAHNHAQPVMDPEGDSPPLAAPLTVTFHNDDSCQHCIKMSYHPDDKPVRCADPGDDIVFTFTEVNDVYFEDETATAQSYTRGNGRIHVIEVDAPATPSPTAPPVIDPTEAPVEPPAAPASHAARSTAPASKSTAAAVSPPVTSPPPTSTASPSEPLVVLPAAAPSSSTRPASTSWLWPAIVAGGLSALAVAGLLEVGRRRRRT